MSFISCKISRIPFPNIGEKDSFIENQTSWDPSKKVFVNGKYPAILVVCDREKFTWDERVNKVGYWILDETSRTYHRQFIGQDMTKIIFVDGKWSHPYLARCITKGKVGEVELEFQVLKVRDYIGSDVVKWCRELNDEQEKQIRKLTERFDILKSAVEDLSFLPGMEGYLEAESHFETRVPKEQLVDKEKP